MRCTAHTTISSWFLKSGLCLEKRFIIYKRNKKNKNKTEKQKSFSRLQKSDLVTAPNICTSSSSSSFRRVRTLCTSTGHGSNKTHYFFQYFSKLFHRFSTLYNIVFFFLCFSFYMRKFIVKNRIKPGK